ncbi:hypothetical protein CPB83DRAFT_848828, partial [Crepidotus variabilis]
MASMCMYFKKGKGQEEDHVLRSLRNTETEDGKDARSTERQSAVGGHRKPSYRDQAPHSTQPFV